MEPGLLGRWTCRIQIPSSNRCDVANVEIDFAELDQGDNDWYDRRMTAVHELGHSTIEGEVPSTDLFWRRYHAHDIQHINAAY